LRINLSEIKEGCILSEDVFSKTNRPLIPKKTVISNMHIDVLKAFLIQDVEIENTLVNGAPFYNHDLEMDEINLGFADLFLRSVNKFKKEFQSWQSGLPVDISKVRDLLIPLLDKMEQSPQDIVDTHRYSSKETYLFQHPVAVGLISGFIGKKLNLEKGDWLQAALAGCLADCGMAKMNPHILQKKSSLTIQEYREVKRHPIISYKMVRNIPILREDVKISILEHHERLDGSGYPLGEKEIGIPKFAKIIAVADIYHAMTSERLYRSKQSPYKVLEMIQEDCFGKFDISIVKVLTASMVNYSTGDKIRLSNGRVAEVLFVDDKMPIRPLIRLVDTGEIIELARNRQLYIESILSKPQ
jgi:HD-GYP domain-containing protein (c-di-GMP phosphodiesterase class II)